VSIPVPGSTFCAATAPVRCQDSDHAADLRVWARAPCARDGAGCEQEAAPAVSLGTRVGLTSPLVLEARTGTRRPDTARGLGGRARARVTAAHDTTAAAAWFGDWFGALTGAGADR
jgi:hypothetical protein